VRINLLLDVDEGYKIGRFEPGDKGESMLLKPWQVHPTSFN
jgi:hypothetical protein